jgi:peptidoglycan/xylan/chitin deacetylase (PgdA/CDA1 family)
MDTSRELDALEVAPPQAAWQELLHRGLRRGARTAAEWLLPASWVVWRQPKRAWWRPGRRNEVALTFDDGPTGLTPAYLDVLERFGVRATFFLLGRYCARNPELVYDIAARGHELASHGYSHRRFNLLSPELLREELFETRRLLRSDRTPTSLVRPPHGVVSLSSLLTSARAGFTNVLWSYDSGDASVRTPGEVLSRFEKRAVSPGAIVLLHEGQRWTLEALPGVLETLKEAGHELVTVGELLGR